MKRREFISLLGAMTASVPRLGQAQERAAVRIGFLRQAGPHQKQFDAFREGLRAAGYVEGQNIVIEQRYAAGAYDRLSALATEVDGTAAAKACKDATASIPIVFALAVDPVADGLAKSFAEPGGNLTGLTMTVGYGLAAKRLELLKDMTQTLSRVAVLGNSTNPTYAPYLREVERATRKLGFELHIFEARAPADLPGAFGAMVDWSAGGMVSLSDAMLFTQRDRIVELELKSRLPAVYPEAELH